MYRAAKFDVRDARCNTPSATPSSSDSDRDDQPQAFQYHPQHRNAFQCHRKNRPAAYRMPKKRKRIVLKGGKELQQLLHRLSAPSNRAASAHLRTLHLALGAQWIRFLPKYKDFEYDRTATTDEDLPVIVLVGTYILASPEAPQQSTKKVKKGISNPKKAKQKFTNTLEIWAHHALPVEPTLNDPTPSTPVEWLVYDEDLRHITDVPGLKEERPWYVKSAHINFLSPFADVRSEAELRCLIRYALLLASTHDLYDIDHTEIRCGIGFTNVLIQQCKRKWEEERFKTYEETGVLPQDKDVWKGAVAIDTKKVQPAEAFSTSESSGEDEIPAVKWGLLRQRPVRKGIWEEKVKGKGKAPEKVETGEEAAQVSRMRGDRFEQFFSDRE